MLFCRGVQNDFDLIKVTNKTSIRVYLLTLIDTPGVVFLSHRQPRIVLRALTAPFLSWPLTSARGAPAGHPGALLPRRPQESPTHRHQGALRELNTAPPCRSELTSRRGRARRDYETRPHKFMMIFLGASCICIFSYAQDFHPSHSAARRSRFIVSLRNGTNGPQARTD